MKIRDRVRELRRVKASDLAPHPRNWRTHPKEQGDALRGLLAEIGFAGALMARELEDGTLQLIDGHLRAETTPDAEVPVLVLDVSAEEADKILATHDPIGAMAGRDDEMLKKLLDGMQTESEALKAMLDGLLPATIEIPAKPDPGDRLDAADELQKKWQVEAGQLWQVGPHRILCGDCTDPANVERLMAGERADSMVTDPPYGVDYADKTEHLERRGQGRARKSIANDVGKDYLAFFTAFLFVAPLAEKNTVYIAMSGPELHTLRLALDEAGFKWGDYLVWVKDFLVLSRKDYNCKREFIVYGWRGTHKFHGPTNRTNVLEYVRPKRSELHPTMKPVELIQQLVEDGSPPAGLVYEPFSGSGTTFVAAAQAGRRCYGFELEPRYVACVLERLTTMGLETRLLDTEPVPEAGATHEPPPEPPRKSRRKRPGA